nr:hypothetical protein CFP56_14188 [Quercus suber]
MGLVIGGSGLMVDGVGFGFGCVDGGVGLIGFGVALVVVGGGSWWIYGFSGGGFVGFWVLEVVVVVVLCWRGC